MKRILLLLLALPSICFAESPQQILPKTLVIKPIGWYADQTKAWQAEIKDNKSNPQAWFNYYAAATFAHESSQSLNAIERSMAAAVPNTYEYFVVKGWNAGYDSDAFKTLQLAYQMNPEKTEAYGLLQSFSEFYLDKAGRIKFSESLYKNGQISSTLLNYSYNVLMSLEPSAILITEGESTTAPLYVLQDVLSVRKDVEILNLDLLSDPSHLKSKIKEAGLTYSGELPSFGQLRINLCSQLPELNKTKKFYYALTLSKENVSAIKEYLYVVGLASIHSWTNIDNVAQIRKNIEKEFLMDYLAVDFNGDTGADAGRVFSPNYLLPMILLYESYQKEGALEQASKLKILMERIARESGKTEIISNFFSNKPSEEIPYFPFAINVKSWEGTFRPVSEKVFANESEVTNAQYNRFLEYLHANNLKELYEKNKFDFSEYQEPALSLMRGYSAPRVTTKKDRQFTNYPAVNISYEAALSYCDWLTQQYNNSPDRKFKKVKFRLPTLDEWQIAAASIKNPTSWKLKDQVVEVKVTPAGEEFGKNFEVKKVSLDEPEILFPWFRYYIFRNTPVNNRGCYLGNFKVPDQITCPGIKKIGIAADGFMAMSATKSYFPNDIGLYDVVGNVAEMIDEKGKACGGSWNHTPEESTIKSVNLYTKPDAAIGFRVFMEVIEK